jgi:hypothetical protein
MFLCTEVDMDMTGSAILLDSFVALCWRKFAPESLFEWRGSTGNSQQDCTPSCTKKE